MSISEELLKRGLITPADLGKAVQLHKDEGVRLDRALLKLGHVDERQLLEITGEQLSLSVLDLTNVKIDEDVLRLLPSKFVYRRKLLPIARENGTLKVVTSDPFNLYVFDEIKLLTGLEVQPVLAPRGEIDITYSSGFCRFHNGLRGSTIDCYGQWDTFQNNPGC